MGLSSTGPSGGGLLMPEPSGGVFGSQQTPLFGDTNVLQPNQSSGPQVEAKPGQVEKQQKVKF